MRYFASPVGDMRGPCHLKKKSHNANKLVSIDSHKPEKKGVTFFEHYEAVADTRFPLSKPKRNNRETSLL